MSSVVPLVVQDVWQQFSKQHEASVPTGDFALWVAGSFVLHWALFLLAPADPWLPKKGESPPSHKGPKPFDREAESLRIRNGLVSTFHAIVAVCEVLVWYWFYDLEFWNWQRNMQGGLVGTGDYWFGPAICVTLGYFLYDTVCMAWYHKALGNTGSYIHHVAIGTAIAAGVCFGVGRTYHFIYIIEELSTPALNFKSLYKDSPRAYNAWSLLFVFTFFLSRGIYGMFNSVGTYYCLYTYWAELRAVRDSNFFGGLILIHFIGFTTSRLLNIYWMSLIAKYIIKGKPKKAVKKVD